MTPGPRRWWARLSLVHRVMALTAALTVLVGLAVAQVCATSVRETALDEEANRAATIVSARFATWLTPADLGAPLDEARRAEIGTRIREQLVGTRTLGVSLWRTDRTSAFASAPLADPLRARQDEELAGALAGDVQREMKDASTVDLELGGQVRGDVMEIYVPLRLGTSTVLGALELYRDPADVAARVAAVERTLVATLAAGLTLLGGVLVLLVRGASSELSRQSSRLTELSTRAEVTRRQTEFVGVVSHELRTPLAALVGFSELLLSPGRSAGDRDDLTRLLNRGARRLQTLVDQLLDLSRLDLDEIPVRLRPTSLASVVGSALEIVGDTGELDVVCTVPQALPRVAADHDRLVQVVVNLVANALKYSPGGGRVVVTAHVVDHDAYLLVRDQGVGIPASQLSTVFDRYQRVESVDTKDIRGAGLGLFITRRLVELQGGAVSAHQGVGGRGSVFVVTLPIASGGAGA